MPRKLSKAVRGESSNEEALEIEALEDAAEARYAEERVNMRWSRGSLDAVREAARLAGVPYQTYVKQASFRQALTALRDAAAAGILPRDAT